MKRFLTILIFITALKAGAVNYFVSTTDGDDSRSAAQAQNQATPWKTVAKVNAMQGTFVAGDIISFKRGDIFPGQLIPTKSGSSGNVITYNAYSSGALPIITGLFTVPSWTSIGGNKWTAVISQGQAQLNMVTIGGVFQAIGRFPKVGASTPSWASGGWFRYSSFSGFTSITSIEISSAPNFVGGEVVIRAGHYNIDRGTITNQTSTQVTLTTPSGLLESYAAGFGFFFQNHPNALTVNGDWSYTSGSKTVTMFNTSTPTNVQVSVLQNNVTITNTSFLTFQNIDFSGANTNSFAIAGSNHITITACTIRLAGTNGVNASGSTNTVTLTGSTLNEIMNSGVDGNFTNTWTITSNSFYRINHIAGMGLSGDGQGFGTAYVGTNTLIQFNSVRVCGYHGIMFGSTAANIVVRNNYVDSFCLTRDDGGGIYTYKNQGAGNKVIQGNIVRNGTAAPNGTADGIQRGGAIGIYLDGASDNIQVLDNSIDACVFAGILFNDGQSNSVLRNTSYNNGSGFTNGSQLEFAHFSGEPAFTNLRVRRNILCSRPAAQFSALYISNDATTVGTFFSAGGGADSNYYSRPIAQTSVILTQFGSVVNRTIASWQSFSGQDVHAKGTPLAISTVNDLRYEINPSSSVANISLGGNSYIDHDGTSYSGTLVLQAWTSRVLIRTGAANSLPVVNAGPDQVITLPTSSVTMAGNATDADGSISSHTWTKLSGPAAGTITTPGSYATTITGLTQGVYTFQLSATDNAGGTSTDVMQVTVNPAANQSPSANAGVDRFIQLPTNTVTQTGSGSDPDGTISGILWTQVSGPSSATIASATSFTSAFNNLVQGVYVFNLRVTDNSGATANDQFQVTVSAANIPPSCAAGSNQTITLPTNSVTLSGSGSDADGSVASFAWTKIAGPGTFNIVSPSNASTVVNSLVAGTYVFQILVTDNQGATCSSTVQVLVNPAPPPNQPPVANASTDKNITLPTSSITQVGSATDADGTVVGYAWTKISGPATFTIVSPTSSTTVINNLVQGTYVFQLTATDNQGATGTDQMTVIVNPAPNQPPVTNAGADQTLTLPTTSATFAGSATDADGTISSHTWTFISGPATPTITTPSSFTSTVTGMSVAGSYTFQLSATDNSSATTTDQMVILVNPAPNQPPVANAGTDKNITLPTNSVTQVGSASDPDGTVVGILWTRISGPATFNIVSPTQLTTVINNLVQGTYVFNLRITDNSGAVTNDQMTLVVNPAANIAPTANAGSNQAITLPTNSVTVVGSGSDPDGTIVGYAWTKISGPATFNIVSPSNSTTVINTLVAGTYVFQLTVTDNQGATGSNTVQIVVNPAPNIPPTANAGADQAITAPTSSVVVNGSGNDPDGTIASYLWTQVSGPSAANIVSSGSATTTINTLIPGVYVFRLTVTDNVGATATNDMQVTVNPAPPPNQPPIANAGTDKNITLPTNSVNQVGGGTDADGTVASYAWTKISGPASGTIVSPTSSTTNITNLTAGTYVFRLTVTDNLGATGTDDATVIVNPAPNQPPISNAGTDKNITLPTNSITQVGSGTDADGTIASYAWSKFSGPATFNIATPSNSTTVINNLVAGTYVFRLTVTDNIGATGIDDMSVIVNPAPNIPPTVGAGPDQTLTLPTSSSVFAGTATDADGTISSRVITFVSGPATPTITTPASFTSTVSGMTVAGSYTFNFSATDNSAATSTDQMIILVNPAPNQSPTSNAGVDIIDTLPAVVTLTGNGTDPDGTISSYFWSQLSGPNFAMILSPTQRITTLDGLAAGTYVFRLRVTDNGGAQATDDISVTVIDALPPPKPYRLAANAGPDQHPIMCVFCSSIAVTLTGTAVADQVPIVSYLWTKIAGPAQGTIQSANTLVTTVTGLVRGTYMFELKVTDASGAFATDTVTVDIKKNYIIWRGGRFVIVAL